MQNNSSGQTIRNFFKELIGGAKQARRVTHFKGKPTSIPITPEPDYICENCGMLVKSGHGHTREECVVYESNPLQPDNRAHRIILPSRNQPKVKLPWYYDSSSTTKIEETE